MELFFLPGNNMASLSQSMAVEAAIILVGVMKADKWLSND
jgi:hypothetical protein